MEAVDDDALRTRCRQWQRNVNGNIRDVSLVSPVTRHDHKHLGPFAECPRRVVQTSRACGGGLRGGRGNSEFAAAVAENAASEEMTSNTGTGFMTQ